MNKQLLATGLFLGLFFQVFSQLPGWSHSSPITVTEHSGALVTNYQLKVTLNTEVPILAGDMLPNGDDIRFSGSCTGGTIFPYWIESGAGSASTIIWVKIDTLHPNESRTIYLNYGNPSATAVSNIPATFVGPHSATDSVSGGAAGGVTDSQRGIRFGANEDILVTAFGKNEPNGTTRYITLFDNATQAILRQIQVSGPAGQYSYQNIPQPVWLLQGMQYILEMHQGSSDGYYFGPSNTQIGQHLTYYDMRYCNGCNQNTFPTNYLNAIHYGYPDLWYFTKKNVTPAPTYVLGSLSIDMNATADVCSLDSISLPAAIAGGEAPFTIAWTGMVSDPAILDPLVAPTDTTEYFVTVTDACGFTQTDSITINVKPLPSLAISSNAPLICNGEFAELSVPDPSLSYLWLADSSTAMTLVVMPSATTTYTVEATNTYGCTKAFSYTQQVNVPVLATVDVAVCANESYTINGNTYNVSGSYIDTLAGITSCDSIVTTNVTMIPLPAATHNVTICYGTTYTIGAHEYAAEGTYIDTIPGAACDSIITTVLTIQEDIDAQIQAIGLTLVADIGGDEYAWVDCNNGYAIIPGQNGSYFEVTANGSYAVAVSVGNCVEISNCVEVTTIGLEEYDLPDNISVFPNPNNGTFTVQSSVSQTISIVDALGKTITTADVLAGQPQLIGLNGLEAGVYFVSSRTKVVRVVIE